MSKFRNIVIDILKENNIDTFELEEAISHSRLLQYISNPRHSFCIISANRNENDSTQNSRNNELLKNDILNYGFKFQEVEGGFIETNKETKEKIQVKEDSVLVYNIPKKLAMELGKKYNQESILFKEAKTNLFYYVHTDPKDPAEFGKIDILFRSDVDNKQNITVFKGNDLTGGYTSLPKSNKPDLKFQFKPKFPS